MIDRRALLLLTACGCGGSGLSVPLELYPPAEKGDLALSATGNVATVQRHEVYDPDDDPEPRVEVLRRVGDVRRIGISHGRVVGRPSDRDALIVSGPDLVLEWIVARRRLALRPALPAGIEWSYLGGTVDHQAGAALLAFAESPHDPLEETDARRNRSLARLELVEVDVRAMRVRGARAVSIEGRGRTMRDTERRIQAAETRDGLRRYVGFDPSCSLAVAPGPRLFVTCRAPGPPDAKRERWIATRYDGLTAVWSATVSLVPPDRWLGAAAILSSASGDGSALVIEHGSRQSGIIEVETTVIVDTVTGAVRRFRRDRQRSLGRVELMVPVPGRPAVAEGHTYYPGSREHELVATSAAFLGISLTDTRTGQITNVLDTSEDAARHLRDASSSTLGILPDGTFVLGMDPRR